MINNPNIIPVFFYIEREDKNLLKIVASKLGLTMSGFVRMAILKALNSEKGILNLNSKEATLN